MGDQDLICFCMAVTRGEIREAILNGATSLPLLKKATQCSTGCGTCEERVRKLLSETMAEIAATGEIKKSG